MTPKKKGGGYVCDDDCPQYKSAKLCSHTLATAVANDNFDSFIASYARVKGAPNLTELITTAMLKGLGRKGAKALTKRKPNAPIQSRFELNHSTDFMVPRCKLGCHPVRTHLFQFMYLPILRVGYRAETHQHRLLVAPTNPFSPCHLLHLHGLLPLLSS